METNELKEILDKYFKLIFVVFKPDFNQYIIHFRLSETNLQHINYKWDNHFDKDTNISAICNQIKETIINSFIR